MRPRQAAACLNISAAAILATVAMAALFQGCSPPTGSARARPSVIQSGQVVSKRFVRATSILHYAMVGKVLIPINTYVPPKWVVRVRYQHGGRSECYDVSVSREVYARAAVGQSLSSALSAENQRNE